jgi:hypothetical protein
LDLTLPSKLLKQSICSCSVVDLFVLDVYDDFLVNRNEKNKLSVRSCKVRRIQTIRY